MTDMAWQAERIVDGINKSGYFPKEEGRVRQTIALAEEVGEFVGAARRYMGMARRDGTFDEMSEELADVVITAWVTAEVFGINLQECINKKLLSIFTRGWKNE